MDRMSPGIPQGYIVAITAATVVETGDENLSREYPRGLYHFSSFKAARHFTTIVNDARLDPDTAISAYLFTNKETDNERSNE